LRLLTKRDRSETELRSKLAQFGFSVSAIDAAIARCRELNYLNDERYARERARSLLRNGRGVGRKIALDLKSRGISAEIAHQALEDAEQEYSSTEILSDLLERRFPNFDYTTADDRERRRVVSFFQRRGFPLDQIFSILKSRD